MRVRLLTTLIASLVLHAIILGGVALSILPTGSVERSSPPSSEVTRLILVRSSQSPLLKSTAPSLPAIASPMASPSLLMERPALPQSMPTNLPASRPADKVLAMIEPKPIVEANPNAHLPAPAPEAILAPTPPPVLNAANGIVFILDVSGSMYEPYAGSTRLTYARQILSDRIRTLKNGTPFAIVLYAQKARASGPLVEANDATREAAIRFILRDVDCGGGTNLPEGLAAAQRLHTGDILLVSDGDLNTTVQNLSNRAREILGDGKHGPELEVFGIAPRATENADQLLQALADDEGGIYQVEQTEGDTGLLTSRPKAPGAP